MALRPVVHNGTAPCRAGRQLLVPQDRQEGTAALSSRLGRARPASRAVPDAAPPVARRCLAPPKMLPPPNPRAREPQACETPKA